MQPGKDDELSRKAGPYKTALDSLGPCPEDPIDALFWHDSAWALLDGLDKPVGPLERAAALEMIGPEPEDVGDLMAWLRLMEALDLFPPPPRMSYDLAHAKAKRAATAAMEAAGGEWHIAVLDYMNTFNATLRKHGY